MKKTYVKPMLSKESFTLTESVAVGCGWDAAVTATMTKPDECTWSLGDIGPFFTGVTSKYGTCAIVDPDTDEYCYNGMTGGQAVFRS